MRQLSDVWKTPDWFISTKWTLTPSTLWGSKSVALQLHNQTSTHSRGTSETLLVPFEFEYLCVVEWSRLYSLPDWFLSVTRSGSAPPCQLSWKGNLLSCFSLVVFAVSMQQAAEETTYFLFTPARPCPVDMNGHMSWYGPESLQMRSLNTCVDGDSGDSAAESHQCQLKKFVSQLLGKSNEDKNDVLLYNTV